jgi:hypothetical protein
MTDETVYVTHGPADLSLAQDLFSTIRNFPFTVHVAMEELESGRTRSELGGRIANADVVVALFTEESANDPWLNQEIGYAVAKGVPVLPVYEAPEQRGGYVADTEGVELKRSELTVTVFNLICRLRAALAPLGALSVPNWFLRFPCSLEGCDGIVTVDLDRSQKELWRMHEHNQPVRQDCETCHSSYFFDAGTFGFLHREDGERAVDD